jgi:hypothetical protein
MSSLGHPVPSVNIPNVRVVDAGDGDLALR